MKAYQLPEPTTVTLCLFSIKLAAGSRRSAIFKAALELKYRRVKRALSVLGRDHRVARSIKGSTGKSKGGGKERAKARPGRWRAAELYKSDLGNLWGVAACW